MKFFKSMISLVQALTALLLSLTGLVAIVIELLDVVSNYSKKMDFIYEQASLDT